MNYELFIAKRIIKSKSNASSISSPIIRIAVIAIALGIIIMMIAIATGLGLQQKIREKLSGFNGHIQITNFDNNYSKITLEPISKKQKFYPNFNNIEGINSVQIYATKAGIIRTETDFEGIVFKGVGADYNWQFFESYLKEGRLPNFNENVSNEVLISEEIANKLKINLNDTFNLFFLKEDTSKPAWLRVVKAVGVYNSGFQEFDKSFLIADIRHIQKMNRWDEDEIGGFEILIDDFDEVSEKTSLIYAQTPSTLNSQNIIEKYPSIFEWISLFDTNIYIIIAIMILVAGINMITALLVLILERTQMVGILKALGAKNVNIRKVFLYNAAYLILKGLFWGNIIGLAVLLSQKFFEFISLNPENYYVNTVPIYLNIKYILLLNVGTMLLCLLMLIVPTLIVSKIKPVKAIKFD
ncbi:MAG TPA: FtsX-like permease family protein [Flavobacteriaceae bacterium]|nr:FtsX-like permease family protein [Flavobacteriaceae bacterium]